MATRRLRIFISSPGDVGQERLIATRVVERLKSEFAGFAELEAVLWEHEPLRATSHFQEQIVPPSQTDIVVCILWSRLGTRLPTQFVREDGTEYASGTEWEFEDAAKSFLARGAPDLMVYRKTSDALTALSDEQALLDRLQQKKALDNFIERWFGSAQSTFKAAFHTFNAPDQFEETLDNHLRRLIRERLPQHLVEEGGGQSRITWQSGSPYRGLEAFDVEHAPVFFGRTRAVGEIKDALVSRATSPVEASESVTGTPAFLLVFGMSGSGKSSLVRAGVLPTLIQPGVAEGIGLWRWGIMRPGDASDDVLKGLAQALLSPSALPELAADQDAFELAALMREAPQRALGPIRAGLRRAAEADAVASKLDAPLEARLCLVIDQMEELWTIESLDAAARETFIAMIALLARSGLVWIIGTMRSDFYPRCGEIPALVALKEGTGQYDLLTPSFAEVGQMIRQPTRAAGLRFEIEPKSNEHLDDALHEAAMKNPEGLPLLEFTLDELYKERTDEGVLTFAAYKKLGGIEGALARRAEDVFESLGATVQAALPAILRALVTVEDGDRLARRRVPLEQLANTTERKILVDAFIKARLLVTDRGENGEAVVGVAHEALLRHWPRFTQQLADDREFLLSRERVSDSTELWEQDGKLSDLLLNEGKPLVEAVDLLQKRRDELPPEVVQYIELSRRKWANLRRRRVITASAVGSAFFLVVSGFGAFSFRQWHNADDQKKLAVQSISTFTTEIPDRLLNVPGTYPILKDISQENLRLLDQILARNPNAEDVKRVIALNYERQGNADRIFGGMKPALDSYNRSHEIFTQLAKDKSDTGAQRDLAVNYRNLGDILLQTGDEAKALDSYSQTLAITTALAQKANDREFQSDLAVSYEKIGDFHWYKALQQTTPQDQKAQSNQAIDNYTKSLNIRLGLAKNSKDEDAQRDLSVSQGKLGNVWLQLGDLTKALNAYGTSLNLRRDLLSRHATPQAERDLAVGYFDRGDMWGRRGDIVRAKSDYEKGSDLIKDLAQEKFNIQAQLELAASYGRYGTFYLGLEDYPKAASAYERSTAIASELARDRTNTQAHNYLVESYASLIWAQLMNHQYPQVIKNAKKALVIDPDRNDIKVNLAHAYLFSNQVDYAIATYLKNEDLKVDAQRTVADVALDDFKTFASKNMTHPQMAQMVSLIQKTRTPVKSP